VAVVGGPAFSFTYPDNLERLVEAGAELLPLDPTVDLSVPEEADGLYAGGGFPEIYADSLAANIPLLADVRRRVEGGLVTWAECGGLLWLSRSLDGHHLCGVIDAKAHMTDRLTMGYRTALAGADSPVASQGTVLRGHEFHYSTLEPSGDGLTLTGRTGTRTEGYCTPTLLASYLHQHLGADPGPAERFVATASSSQPSSQPSGNGSTQRGRQ
jgi:cobyrinic acid a,c-diamide synthase